MASDQWLKLDAYFLAKPFTIRVLERFGPAGVVTWVAYLAACKRNPTQGRFTFTSDADAVCQLLLQDLPLVDAKGQPWTIDEFFAFTGRMKQTKKTRHGHVRNVISTHWKQWQNAQKTDDARERKRRSRAQNGCDRFVTKSESESERENESDAVTSASPPGADATANGKITVDSVAALRATMGHRS